MASNQLPLLLGDRGQLCLPDSDPTSCGEETQHLSLPIRFYLALSPSCPWCLYTIGSYIDPCLISNLGRSRDQIWPALCCFYLDRTHAPDHADRYSNFRMPRAFLIPPRLIVSDDTGLKNSKNMLVFLDETLDCDT